MFAEFPWRRSSLWRFGEYSGGLGNMASHELTRDPPLLISLRRTERFAGPFPQWNSPRFATADSAIATTKVSALRI